MSKYRIMWSTALLLLFVPLASSTPLQTRKWDDFEVKHAWTDAPHGWKCHGPAPDDHVLDMRIALKQDRFDDLVAALYEVSDPSHQKYAFTPCEFSELRVNATDAPLQIWSAPL